MATPASSDADLILSLRAGEARARRALATRYRPLAQRLAAACGIPATEIGASVDRMFSSAIATVTAPGPAPVDFGAALSVALRDEVAAHARRRPESPGDASPPSVAAESVMRDAGLASAELVASWRMLLWAVHVERVDVDRAAQVADVRPDEALAVLRRAEEALANGVIARALRRSDHSHAPFLRLLELHAAGGSDPGDADLLEAHLHECESCSATGRWLVAFRAEPGVTLAAAALGGAAGDYLLSATGAPAGKAAASPVYAPQLVPGKSRGLLVTASAVLAALGLLVVAITAPGVSTLSAQMLRQPTPTTVGDRPTGGAPEPIGNGSPTTTGSLSPVSSSSMSSSSVLSTSGVGPTSAAPTDGTTGTDSGQVGGSIGDPQDGTPDRTIDAGGGPVPTVDNTSVTVAGTGTSASEPSATSTAAATPTISTATSVPGTTAPAPTVSVIAPPSTTGPARPETTPPSTTPPVTTGPTASRPITTRPLPSTPPSASAPVSPPSSGGGAPPPSLVGVRLTDDWSNLTIGVGLGASRSTTLGNYSDRTSAPVVVLARTPVSLLMNLTADGRTCGPVGLLTKTVTCSVGPLAPGETVRLTFSATLVLGSQTASVTLAQG